jgi:hypothetical protein
MGRRPDPSTLRQFAAALRPGAVLHLYQHVASKNKFHVLISATDERSIAFIINSRPSAYIQKRPDLMNRQISMPHSSHRFMAHDSYIACHDTFLLPSREEIVDGLLNRSVDHVGHVELSLYPQIAAGAADSALIAPRDADLIVAAFGQPPG